MYSEPNYNIDPTNFPYNFQLFSSTLFRTQTEEKITTRMTNIQHENLRTRAPYMLLASTSLQELELQQHHTLLVAQP